MSRLASAILTFLFLILPTYLQAASPAQPNFLLIIADDLCWRDLGFTGNKEVHTPNLDQLAKEGMSFTTMFSPATTCSPSRHSLYLGLYCMRAGAYPNHTRTFPGTKSIFTHLKENGYRVALQNKTHVGPASAFPYEHIAGADDLTKTREFIERKADQPWMLAYASNDPHGPWTRGPKEKYSPVKLTIPPYLHDNATTREQLAAYYAEVSKLDEQVGNLMKLLDATKQTENTLVMFVSEQGSSFPYGGKWSVYDNGIRVATICRWPGKIASGSTTKAMMQYVDVAPTFLAAAGVDPQSIDTGCPDVNGKKGFDGESFLGVLLGKQEELRKYVFSQHTTVGINGFEQPYPMRAVRDERYKLIRNLAPNNRYAIGGIHKGEPITSWQKDAADNAALAKRVDWLFKRPAEEFYDLQNDPYEMTNLAADAKYEADKARLQAELDGWMKQQRDEGLATELLAKTRQGGGREAAKEGEGKAGKKGKQTMQEK